MASIGRVFVGGIVGGLVMQAYSLFAWLVLPYNRAFFPKIPVSTSLQQLFFEHSPDLRDGMWIFGDPGSPDPGGVIFLFLKGLPNPMWDLAGSLVLYLLTGLAVSWIYAATAATWAPVPRKGVLFVMLLGAIAAIPSQFRLAIVVGQPIPFSLAMAADTVIEFLLLGVVLALVHRPRAAT
ncbi:MAG: hypothetical protein AB1451_10075 [Nitrospirota bacterium]